MTPTMIERCGAGVIAGAVLWGTGMLVAGPLEDDELHRAELAGSLAWQLGILSLVAVLHSTRATGSGALGRALLSVQTVLILLAGVWTVAHLVDPDRAAEGLLVALDLCWPLGMLWLLIVAIRVAVVHRWTGRARWAPLVAKAWVLVAIASLALLPDWPAIVANAVAMAALYGYLGWVVARDVSAAPADGGSARHEASSPGVVSPSP